MTFSPVAPARTCKAVFGHPNHALSSLAVITASTEATGAPAAYLGTANSGEAWRSTATTETDIWLSMSDDSAFLVGAVGLLFNQTGKSSRCRARVHLQTKAEALAGAGPVYDSGALRAWTPWQAENAEEWGKFTWGGYPPKAVLESRPRHWLHPLMSTDSSLHSFNARAVRITLSGTSPVDYWQVGMLWVSPGKLPPRNLALEGWSRGWEDLSTSTRGSNGRRQVLDRGRLRKLGMMFPLQERAFVDNYLETWSASVGSGQPLLVIAEPGKPATWWYDAGPFSLETLQGSTREPSAADMWQAPLSLLEWR